jgi:DNA invertase Pin-like site-specific DNA recombinase
MERAENRTAKTKTARELREDDLARIAEILNNGVSQRKIAEAMGVSQSFVQRKNRQPRKVELPVQ